jgi:cell division protease FtsH
VPKLPPDPAMNPKARFNLIYLVVAVALVMLLQQLLRDVRSVAVIPYSEFQHLLHDKKISDVEIVGETLQGTLKRPDHGKTHFVTTDVDPRLAEKLDAAGVKYGRRPENTLLPNLLSWLVPGLLVFFVWAVVMRRMAAQGGGTGGLMAVGKSKAKVYVETDTKVTFADVAGVDESKQELQEIVAFLKDPTSYGRLGARMQIGRASCRERV